MDLDAYQMASLHNVYTIKSSHVLYKLHDQTGSVLKITY